MRTVSLELTAPELEMLTALLEDQLWQPGKRELYLKLVEARHKVWRGVHGPL